MVSKIDMQFLEGLCPFVGNSHVRCRDRHDKNPFAKTQYICECIPSEPAPQTKMVV